MHFLKLLISSCCTFFLLAYPGNSELYFSAVHGLLHLLYNVVCVTVLMIQSSFTYKALCNPKLLHQRQESEQNRGTFSGKNERDYPSSFHLAVCTKKRGNMFVRPLYCLSELVIAAVFCFFCLCYFKFCYLASLTPLSPRRIVKKIPKKLLFATTICRSGKKLKRLTIACCYGMVCDGLDKAILKLPMLEELNLTHTDITTEAIEALGCCCPRLKSFELNNTCYMRSDINLVDGFDEGESDEGDIRNNEGLAIAKNLPTLQHIQLIGNNMTNEGLQAILDSCPNLVSLDLRRCFNVSLNEVLSSRISQQIKDVKYQYDSLAGFKFSFESWGTAGDGYNMYDDYYYGF